MEIKTLAKAIALQEKIEEKQRAFDQVNNPDNSIEIFITGNNGEEYPLTDSLHENLIGGIRQAAKSELEIELKRLVTQFDAL